MLEFRPVSQRHPRLVIFGRVVWKGCFFRETELWGMEMTSRPKTSIRQKQMSEHQFGLVNTDGQMCISRLPAAARASTLESTARERARSRRAPHSLFYRRLIGHILFSARRAAGNVIYWTIAVRGVSSTA